MNAWPQPLGTAKFGLWGTRVWRNNLSGGYFHLGRVASISTALALGPIRNNDLALGLGWLPQCWPLDFTTSLRWGLTRLFPCKVLQIIETYAGDKIPWLPHRYVEEQVQEPLPHQEQGHAGAEV